MDRSGIAISLLDDKLFVVVGQRKYLTEQFKRYRVTRFFVHISTQLPLQISPTHALKDRLWYIDNWAARGRNDQG